MKTLRAQLRPLWMKNFCLWAAASAHAERSSLSFLIACLMEVGFALSASTIVQPIPSNKSFNIYHLLLGSISLVELWLLQWVYHSVKSSPQSYTQPDLSKIPWVSRKLKWLTKMPGMLVYSKKIRLQTPEIPRVHMIGTLPPLPHIATLIASSYLWSQAWRLGQLNAELPYASIFPFLAKRS